MSYNSKPDAEHIKKFAERMKRQWAQQSILDEGLLKYMLLVNEVDTAASGNRGIKGFRSGIGGLLIREDAALITVTPGLHVNVPTDDPEDEEHASGVLEPWLAGAWHLSQQAGKVWDRLPQDLRGLGRAWSVVNHYDNLWSDDNEEYQGLKKDLANAESEEEIAAARKEMRRFKQDTFPIRWRYVDPRSTWSAFDGVHWLPEVVEIRKMRAGDLRDQFGEDVTGDLDDTDLEVIEWANWEYCATIISKGEPNLIHEFHHKLGKSPYTLLEADLMPPNDKGWRWCGGLFYSQFMIDTFDEVMSDLRESHRANTLKPIVIAHDIKAEQAEVLGGRPKPYEYGPGKTIHIWNTEKIESGPTFELKVESIQLLQEVKQLIQQNMYRPVERGESKSGDSGNIFITKLQIAEREFDPSMRAIVDGARDVCRSFLRSVTALGEEVYVMSDFKGKGAVGLGPKDVRGWENAIQPRASRAIPIDRNIQVSAAQGLLNMGVSRRTVYEQELGYENPQAEIDRGDEEKLDAATFQMMAQQVLVRAGQIASQATPDELAKLTEMFGGASPGLQELMSQSGAVVPAPGNVLQGQANVRRTGSPQNPQTPELMAVP